MRSSRWRLSFTLSLFFALSAQAADETIGSMAPEESAPPMQTIGVPADYSSPAYGVNGTSGDIRYHSFNMTRRTPLNAAVRSALVPGWGQGFNQQRIKGAVFFTATMSALAGSLYMNHRADENYDKYKASGEKNSSHYDDYESDQTIAWALGGAAAVLWGVAVIDAYRQAYSPLYSKTSSMELVVLGENIGVVYKKSF